MAQGGRKRPAAAATLVVFALAYAVFFGAVLFKAWLCDDAYITFRTVENCVRGFGLGWNADERVQAYTHPLWMLLVLGAHRCTHEIFYTAIVLGVVLSNAAVLLLALRLAPAAGAAVLGLTVLAASRAFTDYATSGLENPLAHVLLALFAGAYLSARGTRRDAWVVGGWAGLVLMTRLDAGLLVLPALLGLLVRPGRGRTALALLAGMLPFLLWEAFALFYYGSPVPNSAFAKLHAGLGTWQLVPRGLQYLANSLVHDPITLATILIAAALPVLRRDAKGMALGAGALLYLLYIVRVGGDFMSGRFLTAPLFVATVLLVRANPPPRLAWPASAALLLLLLLPAFSPFRTRVYGERWDAAIDDSGIADERAFYVERSSLRRSFGQHPRPQPELSRTAAYLRGRWRQDPLLPQLARVGMLRQPAWPPEESASPGDGAPRPVVVRGAVGILGHYLGPEVHVLDFHAIGDPLLARLPAAIPDPMLSAGVPRLGRQQWRPGHLCRLIPDGYPETLSSGRNRIADPDLAACYDRIALVARAPLLAPGRLRAIWELNTGRCEPFLRAYLRRHPEAYGTSAAGRPARDASTSPP